MPWGRGSGCLLRSGRRIATPGVEMCRESMCRCRVSVSFDSEARSQSGRSPEARDPAPGNLALHSTSWHFMALQRTSSNPATIFGQQSPDGHPARRPSPASPDPPAVALCSAAPDVLSALSDLCIVPQGQQGLRTHAHTCGKGARTVHETHEKTGPRGPHLPSTHASPACFSSWVGSTCQWR